MISVSACRPENAVSDRFAEPTITRRSLSRSSKYIFAWAILSFTTKKRALSSATRSNSACRRSSEVLTATNVLLRFASTTPWKASTSLRSGLRIPECPKMHSKSSYSWSRSRPTIIRMLAVYVSARIDVNPANMLMSNGSTRWLLARTTDNPESRVKESGSSKPSLRCCVTSAP